nr:MAG TPA: hypothetical protein [Caudoviricetes sp.]
MAFFITPFLLLIAVHLVCQNDILVSLICCSIFHFHVSPFFIFSGSIFFLF